MSSCSSSEPSGSMRGNSARALDRAREFRRESARGALRRDVDRHAREIDRRARARHVRDDFAGEKASTKVERNGTPGGMVKTCGHEGSSLREEKLCRQAANACSAARSPRRSRHEARATARRRRTVAPAPRLEEEWGELENILRDAFEKLRLHDADA